MSTIQLINLSVEDLLDTIESRLRVIVKEETNKGNNLASEREEYLTRKEVAQILKIDLSTVNNWKKSGKLKGYQIGGRVFFLKSELPQSLKSIRSQNC